MTKLEVRETPNGPVAHVPRGVTIDEARDLLPAALAPAVGSVGARVLRLLDGGGYVLALVRRGGAA